MAPVAQIGSWQLGAVPADWELLPEGLRRTGENVFPSNVVVSEEPLPEGMTLKRYVENQVEVMQQVLTEPKIQGPETTMIFGSEPSYTLRVSYESSERHRVVQAQIYTAIEDQVGIVTFTTLQQQQAEVEKDFKAIAKALRFEVSEGK